MYKFRNVTLGEFEHYNFEDEKTELQLNWQSYLSMAICIPNVIFLQLNTMFGHKFKAKPRVLTVFCINILLFIFLLTMTKINTDAWQYEFMIATLSSVAILSVLEAVILGAVFGVVGRFPPEYIGAVIQGTKYTIC